MPLITKALNINPYSLTTENYLDSALIKRYAKKIDSNKIKIELKKKQLLKRLIND